MNGVHDMGGMDGFGKVEAERDEPVFHASWEGRVLGMTRSMGYGGAFVIDQSRYAVERIAPDIYLSASYYEKWALALERNVLERGFVDADELALGRVLRPGKPLTRKLTEEVVRRGMARGKFSREPSASPRFVVGNGVRAKNIHPTTHTRLPRYVRGRVGVIERLQGCHVFPDSVAIDQGEDPQWLYVVRFDSRELWGPDADPTVRISIDAFEPYLEPA